MNTTPQGERIKIVLLGRCNAGKSSLINAIAGQEVAIVSNVSGTTTDPVRKAMEILPIGPVLLCDTPGLDDEGELGIKRIERTRDELRSADLAIVVIDNTKGIGKWEEDIISEVRGLSIPIIAVVNQIDRMPTDDARIDALSQKYGIVFTAVSSVTKEGIDKLKLAVIKALPDEGKVAIASDLVKSIDVVILVVPIDSAAPKGRLILPQQQVIRDLLDAGVMPFIVRDSELAEALDKLKEPPALVITDSQVFARITSLVPDSIPLTSFSILFARYKGDIHSLIRGAHAVASLRDGDRVLIAEGCTHHKQKDDIGTVKIPKLLAARTGKNLIIEHSSGMGYPKDLSSYALVIHCGGCILNRREMLYRIRTAEAAGVPIVNYGIILAYLNGILDRTTEPLNCAD